MVGERAFDRMRFSRGHYGPYSVQVEYLLKSVNGKYIHGLEEMNAKPFENLELEYDLKPEVSGYVHLLSEEKLNHVRKVLKLIEGFESAFALEVLATATSAM